MSRLGGPMCTMRLVRLISRPDGRVGRVRDPFGNVWWVQTRIEDVSPEEMERRFADPRIAAAMEYMQRPDRAIFAGGECGRR
ncbi:hypothetical protein ACFWVM_02265 [Nocardia fluminea]|uniref:hypothetical protein n=1 Tax=Nocardia fluminea TaxID=134984 RepID=UPI00366691B5